MRKLTIVWMAAAVATACGDDSTIGDDDVDPPASREFALRIENVAPWRVLKSGTQAQKTNGMQGPAGPGEAFEITFSARDMHFVSFATMLGESNDWFFAPGPEGIPLFTNGRPTSGDVTRYVKLWDAGTELDEEPAVGRFTAPRQPAPNSGEADPEPGVREVPGQLVLDTGRMFARPATPAMIRVTLTPGAEQQYTLRIENVSTPSTLMTSMGPMPVHLAPLAWAMHAIPAPLFQVAAPASAGIERAAEDGMPGPLGEALAETTGFHTPVTPGVFAIHDASAPLFAAGEPDRGQGLEPIAEDGNPMQLAAALAAGLPGVRVHGAFDTPLGTAMPGPAMPGQAYEFTFRASEGDRLSFVTMFGMSNDWFFTTPPDGIALFAGGAPRAGDLTGELVLYDAGTEIDEELAIGPATAPQQPAPNTGALDPDRAVREVTAQRYAVPVASHLKVSVQPR